MASLPTGTVTFLFTDLEGSTRLWEELPDAMGESLATHDRILEAAITRHGGVVFSRMGDGMAAAFASAPAAVAATIDAQVELAHAPWGATGPLRARMGLHTGDGTLAGDGYVNPPLNRCARLMAVANGGQILMSGATEAIARDSLPPDVELVDLGEHRLRDLARPVQVFQVTHTELERDFPPLRSLDSFPGNLPFQLSSFVGREADLARVEAAMSESRVTTLTGVGGVGKTRLAQQVAADLTPQFRDGTWLCELAPIRDSAAVIDAVANVFGVVARADVTLERSLVEFLRNKQLLLVLDNCEHLLEPSAALVETVERACRDVVVLATSREGLGIDGERILAVRSLEAPTTSQDVNTIGDVASVRLFVERAQSASSEFRLTEKNAPAVAQICRQLDGVPLAIELAAARVPAMNPAELAKRLDQRFQVLAGGRRGAVERHQTLRAAIDWSYDLLSPPEQMLLNRLTVFRGGCTLEAVEAVCAGDPVDESQIWELLAALVARSLVVAEDLGFQTRYRLLETIRQYGEERLDPDELAALRRKHAEYFIGFVAELTDQMLGPEQFEAGDRYALEHENVLAVFALAQDVGDFDLAVRLITAAPSPMVQRDFELRLPYDAALAIAGAAEHQLFPLALAFAAVFVTSLGELERGGRFRDEALRTVVPGSPIEASVKGMASIADAFAAFGVGEWRRGAAIQERSIPIFEAMGDTGGIAITAAGVASQLVIAGDPEAAAPFAEMSVQAAREVGMPSVLATSLASLAGVLAKQDPSRAASLLDESLSLHQGSGHAARLSLTHATLIASLLGDWAMVLKLSLEVIPLIRWSGDAPQLAGILNVAARALAASDPGGAAVLQGASRQFVPTEQGQAPPPMAGGLLVDTRREATALIRDAIGEEALRARRAEGEALDADAAVRVALAVIDGALAPR